MSRDLHVVVSLVAHGQSVLIVRRKHAEGTLKWQFPGGKKLPRESQRDTAVRETLEETNVLCQPVRRIGSRVHPDTGVKLSYWLCKYRRGVVRINAPREVSKVRWVSKRMASEIFTSNLFPPVRRFLESGQRLSPDPLDRSTAWWKSFQS